MLKKKFRFIGDEFKDFDTDNSKKNNIKAYILFMSITFFPLILVSILKLLVLSINLAD